MQVSFNARKVLVKRLIKIGHNVDKSKAVTRTDMKTKDFPDSLKTVKRFSDKSKELVFPKDSRLNIAPKR